VTLASYYHGIKTRMTTMEEGTLAVLRPLSQ